MSGSEDSDDQELRELIAEYAAKEKQRNEKDEKKQNGPSAEMGERQTDLYLSVPMDKYIFGDKNSLLENFSKAAQPKVDSLNVEDNTESTKKRKPVWTDPDDHKLLLGQVKRKTKHTGPLGHLPMNKPYKEHLTTKFTRIVAQPKWASLDTKLETNDSDDEILQTSGILKNQDLTDLPSEHIRLKRLKNLNRTCQTEGAITNIQFHPSSTAALVAGESGYATIYSVDGIQNDKLHSMHFKDFPLKCVKITPDGTKAIFGSTRIYYYLYDLLTGKETRYVIRREKNFMNNFTLSPCGRYMAAAGTFGALYLYDLKTQEVLHDFKQEDGVTGIVFTSDSQRIICGSRSNYVSIFSIRQCKQEHSFVDEGCLNGWAVDLAPNQRLLATGSKEGVVNIYDFEKIMESKTPEPMKRLMNLRTGVAKVKFNHSSELLGFSSREVNGAVKLAHFPSSKVFPNFPNFKSDLGKITVIEFSPQSGYMALGNRGREAPLFRVKHFSNY